MYVTGLLSPDVKETLADWFKKLTMKTSSCMDSACSGRGRILLTPFVIAGCVR